jgi:hypothetical protein
MSKRSAVSEAVQGPGLRRSLGLGLLVFYGLGIIIGASVYVVFGDVIAKAGTLAVCSFAVACLGVKDSVRAAAVMTIVELGGLLLVVSAGIAAQFAFA